MISPPLCGQAQEMGPRVTSAFTAVGIGWTCAVQLLANGRNQDVKCEDFHTTLHSEVRTANDRLVSEESPHDVV